MHLHHPLPRQNDARETNLSTNCHNKRKLRARQMPKKKHKKVHLHPRMETCGVLVRESKHTSAQENPRQWYHRRLSAGKKIDTQNPPPLPHQNDARDTNLSMECHNKRKLKARDRCEKIKRLKKTGKKCTPLPLPVPLAPQYHRPPRDRPIVRGDTPAWGTPRVCTAPSKPQAARPGTGSPPWKGS